MTRVELAGDAGSTRSLGRRVLLVFMREAGIADVAEAVRASANPDEVGDLTVQAYQSTGGYHPDPNRPQEFVSAAGAVQVDYLPEQEPALIQLLHRLDVPVPVTDVTISVGAVVTRLEPAGPNLLLLGAQRRPDLSTEQFGRHWSEVHAPRAEEELRAAPVPIGYELFLVDHGLGEAAATDRWRPGVVDGWMHITTPGPSDFGKIARDPAHRAWVLEDESNFVDFAAPLVGQQMLALPHTAVPQTTK